MAEMTNPFENIVIPSVEEMDASLGLSPAGGNISRVAVNSGGLISPPSSEMNITQRYDALGIKWEKCPLVWNASKRNRDGSIGGKDGVRQHCGKSNPSHNGYLLSMENLLAIDIDGTCEKCVEVAEMCDAVCVWKAKTRKGHHFIFKKDPRIKQYAPNKPGEAEIDTRTNKGSVLLVEPSFYIHPTEGKIEYKWERIPERIEDLTECPTEVLEWLLENPGYCSEPTYAPAPAPAPPRNVIVHQPPEEDVESVVSSFITPPPVALTIMEQVENLCSCLTPEWLSDHNNWIRLLFVLKNISSSVEMKEMFLKHSARAPSYSSEGHRRQNEKIWNEAKQAGRSGMGSLKHWAKKCNPEKYFADAKSSYWALVNQENANGYCEIFYNAMAGDILYSNSHKCYYVYDERETLWKVSENNSYINFLFVEITSSVFRKMMADLPPARDEEEANKRKAKIKKLTEASKTCGGAYVITLVSSFLPAFCRSEDDPANYFNQNPDLLPLANGVWKFSEKKLVPYERDHYFTFRIPINYNPSADTSAIRRASLDWFGQDADVARFVQFWIGYCLTGHTTRQDFLVIWGTKAGNGKSLLWGTILSILLDKYYRTITSDALSTERVGNNDQLYNLNGGRFAFLSEPRRAKGTKIDNEIVKTITGDKYFTAEAKYKNAITFKLQAKVGMACNDMPDFKFDDKGTYRRVRVCEQNCEFLDPADYEKADPSAKASKRVMLKDDAFIADLLENTEGLMLWALEGASLFVDNPRMEAPEAMNSAKKKAVDETDVLGNWIKANIRNLRALEVADKPAGWERKNLKFKAVKDMMRLQNVNMGQNVVGFNKRFKEKLEALGYEVGGREDKGDQYIRYADEVPDEMVGDE